MTTTTTLVTPVARKAGTTDRPAVAAAMAAAFQDDPVFRWLSPDSGHRRRILPAFFELAIGAFARHDEIWCVGRTVVGGAIWSPAGAEPTDEAEGQQFAERVAEIVGADAERWHHVIELLEEYHPHHAEHDYLWLLGVTPSQQGRGYGSALLRPVLQRDDRAGVPAYLEATSPDNRRLYERHGFEVTREIAIAGGSVPVGDAAGAEHLTSGARTPAGARARTAS